MADAKMVRTDTPAGVVTNYIANTGNSYHAYPVSTSLIKKMIDRGVLVYEQLAEENEKGETEVLLDSDTYSSTTTGAVTVGSDTLIIPDIEQEIINRHAAEYEELLKEKGLAIKDKQTSISNKFLGIEEEVSGGGEPVTEDPKDNPSTPTVEGGGEPVTEDPKDNPSTPTVEGGGS